MKALLAQHSMGRQDVSDLYGREGMRWLESILLLRRSVASRGHESDQ
jgi:hypothetical protein